MELQTAKDTKEVTIAAIIDRYPDLLTNIREQVSVAANNAKWEISIELEAEIAELLEPYLVGLNYYLYPGHPSDKRIDADTGKVHLPCTIYWRNA